MRQVQRLDKRTAIVALLSLGWALFTLHTLGAFGGAGADFFDDWVYIALLAGAAAACLGRALTFSSERLTWLLMAGAISVWTLGEV